MRRSTLFLVGAGGVVLGGVGLVALLSSSSSPRPSGSDGWILLSDPDVVRLEDGVRYRGCVQVPFPIPTSMVFGKLAAALAEKGFTEIELHRDARPAGWPEVDCDIWVEATWSRRDEVLDRPGAVEFAWRERGDDE